MHLLNAQQFWEVQNDSKNLRERSFLLLIKVFGIIEIDRVIKFLTMFLY